MSVAKISVLATFASQAFAAGQPTRFFSENGGLQESVFSDWIPSQYNLSDSQVPVIAYANSYWSSSYITGDDGHEYLALSHVLITPQLNIRRASIADLTDLTFQQFSTAANASAFPSKFALEYDDYFMGTTTSNNLGPITTWSTNPAYEFNITYELSSPVIFNGGDGSFLWGENTTVNEWSMPSGRTNGYFVKKNGTTVNINPLKSFSWYDRQWQAGPGAANWTWFELHLDSRPGVSGTKLSMWFYPGTGGEKGFATLREEAGVNAVIPATYVDQGSYWTSSNTNHTYALDWTVNLADGTTLNITTTMEDQELYSNTGFATYEGFVEVEGTTRDGIRTAGYGLVEVQPVTTF